MIESLIHSLAVCPDMNKIYPKIQYGKGIYLFDQNGKKYIDASSGSCAVSNIGHGRTEIADVIHDQVCKISVLPTHAFSSEIVESYMQKLVEFAPPGFKKAWTVMSGTEAVENAVKLALQYHRIKGEANRFKIISRWNSYHGNSVFMLDLGGMKLRRESFSKWHHNFSHISPAYEYRKPVEMTINKYVKNLWTEFEECLIANGPETVAAFVAEPVVAAALGAVPPPEGYFKGIKEICEKYGVLFISDEVLCGFGRTGEKFGIENYDVVPDIIAAGKGISGGYFPLSAVFASGKVMNPFIDTNAPFMGGHTFACNPVGAAVGMKVLDILKEEDLVNNSKKMGALFLDKLQKLLEFSIIGDVRGVGLQCGIEIVQNKVTKSPFPQELNISNRIAEKSIKKGVVLYPGSGSVDGRLGNHILITPPLTVIESELDEIVNVLQDCIKELSVELKTEISLSKI